MEDNMVKPAQKEQRGQKNTPASDMDLILKRLEESEKQLAALRAIQDQGMLKAAEVNANVDQRMKVRVRTINDKVITSWAKMPLNDVRLINGEIVENQNVALIFQDGSKLELSYKDYNDSYVLSPYYPVERIIQERDGRVFELELPDGTRLTIGEQFTN